AAPSSAIDGLAGRAGTAQSAATPRLGRDDDLARGHLRRADRHVPEVFAQPVAGLPARLLGAVSVVENTDRGGLAVAGLDQVVGAEPSIAVMILLTSLSFSTSASASS